VWMPEVGLGIGCEQGSHEGYQEWLYWYNQRAILLPAPANVIEQERQRAGLNSSLSKSGRALAERQRAERAQQQQARAAA